VHLGVRGDQGAVLGQKDDLRFAGFGVRVIVVVVIIPAIIVIVAAITIVVVFLDN
jgi:hypothetical protein